MDNGVLKWLAYKIIGIIDIKFEKDDIVTKTIIVMHKYKIPVDLWLK